MSQVGRREFLKKAAVALSVAPATVALLKSRAIAEPATLPPLEVTNPMAAALGYQPDASKVDFAKFPKKPAPAGVNQRCANCVLYTKGGLTVAGKEGEFGACTLFPQNVVAANGWCNSWVLKPGATS